LSRVSPLLTFCNEYEAMTLPPVSPLLNSLFNVARAKYKAENETWVQLSYRLSGRFKLVMAVPSIQREKAISTYC
jgi:hypothetical protein